MLLRRALLVACAVSAVPRGVSAVRYELFIDIDTEEDLYDLRVTEQISERSFNALLLLHQTRVELNEADREELYLLPNLDYGDVDRILAYREEAGWVRSMGDLVAAGVLSPEVADSLHAFVLFGAPANEKEGVAGFVRGQLRWTGRHDRLPPATALQARLRRAADLDAGLVAVLTRSRVRRVKWDPARRGLTVEPERVRLEVPKAYITWETDRSKIAAGTYRVGFGQRLTFDVTDQATPNGLFGDYELRRENELDLRCRRGAGERAASPCPEAPVARVTPDFTWTNRLTGLGVGLKRRPVGPGWMQAYIWGSYQVHRALSSEIVLAGCTDPRRDDDPSCASPRVYVREANAWAPAATISSASLPAVVGEGLAGANASYFWSPRNHLGVTGYGAVPRWRVDGVALDFQEHARKPFGGAFGAVGVNASAGLRRQDFFAEVARSFDRQAGGGGGFGAIVRSVTTLSDGEIDVSARYYEARYANPYARPISAPDELDGLRARDEVGARVRAAAQLAPRLALAGLADAWKRLSSGLLSGLVFVRLDLRLAPPWGWAFWVEHRSASRRTLLATRFVYAPIRTIELSWQAQHRWLDASLAERRRQQDLAAVLSLTARPLDPLRVRLRARYDFNDLFDNHRLAQTLWVYADTAWTLRDRDVLRLRYDLRAYLDERESTRVRAPNPEHWLWLEYVFRY